MLPKPRRKYDEAKRLLESKLQKESGLDKVKTEIWIQLNELRSGNGVALEQISELCTTHSGEIEILKFAANILNSEGHPELSIKLLKGAATSIQNDPKILICLADSYLKMGELPLAIGTLQLPLIAKVPEIAIRLSEILEDDDKKQEAFDVALVGYADNPVHEKLRFRLARIADSLDKHEIALCLLGKLTRDFPDNSDYWGYLANTCYALNLYDRALHAYRKGVEKGGNTQWIIANIGNIMNVKKFHTEAITYLEQATKPEGTQYVIQRLAAAIKERDEEIKLFEEKCVEGAKQLRAAASLQVMA